MLKLKYIGEEDFYNVSFSTYSPNCIKVTGAFPVETKGFELFKQDETFLGNYKEFKTVYKEIFDGAIFSDDGSVYVEPEPYVPPEPPLPTVEEAQELKVVEMNKAQQEVIAHGLNVTLSDGKTYPFSLTTNDQISIMGSTAVQGMIVKGTPWHIADESVHCVYFSDEDMQLITSAAYKHVTFHVTYFRDLRIYIRSLQTRKEIDTIFYGCEIPEEYQSEVLKDMLALSKQE